jgi:hypothetical protein
MIRRNVIDENGAATWLLISQVEHARISGELTQAWHEPNSQEVIDAITHHDDGWSLWEAAPQLDPARGRPLSFMEMAVADAIKIWDRSIAAARRFGPLAGAIVAGHFLGLAGGSEHASQSPAREWLAEKNFERTRWLDEWRAATTDNTPAVADRAQQMLLAADLLSLWLCLDGPVTGAETSADASPVANREMQSRSATVLGKYRFETRSTTLTGNCLDWAGSLAPWPFAAAELRLAAPALAVPAARYESWPAIVAAGAPCELRWRLRQTLPAFGEC